MEQKEKTIRDNYAKATKGGGIFEISQMSHLISKRINQELSRLNFPLQMDQLPALSIVYLSGDTLLSQQEIADTLQRDKSGIQRAIRVLERDGYIRIVADAADRRKNLIRLTPPGKVVVEQAIHITGLLNNQLMATLSPEERDMLNTITSKLTETLTNPAT